MSSSAPALALRKKPKKRLSSGAAAQRDESEFVSVEVGMREFQRRLASSKNNGGNKESSRSTAVSSRSPSSRGQPRDKSDGALPPAPEQPKKRARTSTPAAATPTATQSTSSAVSAVRKSTATAPRARKPAASATGSTDPPVLQDPVKTPPKRAAPTQTAPAKARAKAPATATPAIKKPRAAPVARRQTTIAEIRAQLLREQQERVELRIQTLHCTNCNSVTHAHADEHVHTGAASDMPSVAAAPVVEPHRSIYEQQQERQQQPVTTHSVQYQPPLLLPIQHTAPLQAPAIHPKAVVRKEAPPALRVNAPASIAQPTVAAAPSEPDPIKNEFISDDFNEDMAFMLALDEVERSLTTPPALIMTPVVAPPSSLSGDLHQHFAPISTHPQPTGGSQMLGPSQPVRVKFKTEPSHQTQAPAMSADVQREFERLKRENELLRQSNELLQAAAVSSSLGTPAGATAAHPTLSRPPSFAVSPPPQNQQTRHFRAATAMRAAMPSPASSSSVRSNTVLAASSDDPRALQTTNPLPAVVQEDSQHQPAARRLLNLHQSAVTIKQEPVWTDTSVPSPGAACGISEGNDDHSDQSGSESAARSHGTPEIDQNRHRLHHHQSPHLAPTTASDESRSLPSEHQSNNADEGEPTQSQAAAEEEDHGGNSHVVDAHGHSFEREGDEERVGDVAEDNDQSQDVVDTQRSTENEDSGGSPTENVNEPYDEVEDEDEEEALEEPSQEEISRVSTIDRGNYHQYKAHDEEEADDDEEETGNTVHGHHAVVASMDVDDEGTQSERIPSLRQSPDRHSSPSKTVPHVCTSEQPAVEIATRSSTSPSKTMAEADGESKRSSSEPPVSDFIISAIAGASHKPEEQAPRDTTVHAQAQEGVTEMDVEGDDDDVTPWGEIKSDMAVEAAGLRASDYEEEEEEVGAPQPPATAKARLRVQEISSSSESDSETESEEEENDEAGGGRGTANMLEAALKAAASGSNSASTTRGSSPSASQRAQQGAFSLDATGSVKDQPKLGRDISKAVPKKRPRPSDTTIPVPDKKIARAKHQLGSTTTPSSSLGGSNNSNSNNAAVKSTLLWPALDEFYEFILELSPRRIEVPDKHQANLRRYFRSTLPAKYTSLSEYTSVQIEAIMEELAASLRSSEQFGNQNSSKSLFLTSVSPCGQQQLNSSSIFMESGFSGTTSGKNDFILTFRPQHSGRGGGGSSSPDFISGDLIMLRSPRWKQYEVIVYGVVLCNSVVAIGGSSSGSGSGGGGSRGGGDNDNDLICVLIRTREHDHANPKEDFSVLTEMCLANQRSANWKWRLEQVHNLTTSAREFQAIKSVSFFSPSIKRSLLEGKMSASEEQKGKSGGGGSDGKAGTATSKEAKSRLTPALHTELAKKYNTSQLEAILGCIGKENHVIIQGPPGTGKTKTILGVLSALLDGAALGGPKKSKESTRIRIGASLNNGNTSSEPRTVAETTIRILVAAPSNAAVDELIVRLLSEGVYDGVKGCTYRPRIVRVGRPESLQQQPSSDDSKGKGQLQTDNTKIKKKKWRKYAQEVEEILLENLVTKHKNSFPNAKTARQGIVKNAQIVFCTLSGAGSVAMCEFAHEFDALVIDEAAQAVEASALIPFKFRPNRVILVGDHRQLPATVISKKLLDVGYDRSLFQRFVENGSQVFLLNRQYRMHPDISEFPSRYFYKGKLVQDAKMKDWTARKYHADKLFKPFLFYDVLSGQQSQVSGSKSLRNLTEVEFILLLVRSLLKKYPEMDWRKKIGIIAPYKQQIYELGSHLARLENDVDKRLDIEVNTVDGFQGREKEIIIYSCVRTSGGGGNRRRGKNHGGSSQGKLDAFWADERRMNVAITRAKSSLWIVGNSQLLEQSRAWRALIRTAKDHDKYILNTDAGL